MTQDELKKLALAYHHDNQPGKVAVVPTKPCETGEELALAYTPGVAQPCLAIKEKKENVWEYTSRGNLVAVVSDGTAVLGLGNIGPEAGLPVMTFGGINLEDIGAPACFEVEQTLKKRMNIPVFHDDQHGTAIISLAAILNALKIVGKKIEECRFVVNGAGAAGISCSRFYLTAGAKRENFIMCDSKGVIHRGRTDLNPEKAEFAAETSARTLEEAMKGADIFLGFSAPNCVTPEMVRSMAKDSIIFAMANPVPEIFPDVALAAGAAIVGTGRSDYPNQINNVLGFPGIFRGALDVRARDINEAMKLAAAKALAELAAEPVTPEVKAQLAAAYPADAAAGMFDGEGKLKIDCVIPKPFDPRVVPRVAMRVAEAAMQTGVAQIQIDDLAAYEASVAARIRK